MPRTSDLARLARHSAAVAVFSLIGTIFARLVVADSSAVSMRWLLALLLLTAFTGLALFRLRSAIVVFIVYSAVVGLLRRLVPADGAAIDALLVGIPVGTIAIAAVAVRRGATQSGTNRSTLVYVLLALALVGALNPLQGSPLIGGVGIAFFGVPMLWFFVGRHTLTDHDVSVVLRTAAIVAVPIGIYGLLQSRGHFLARDRLILEAPGGAGSFLDGKLRPIGTMASTGEFARFSMVAAMIWLVAALFAKDRRPAWRWAFVPFAVLLAAAVLSGVRVSLVTSLVTLGLLVAASSKLRPMSSGLLGVASILLALVVIQIAAQAPTDNFILDRQLSGLSDPTDPSSATISKRIKLAQRTLGDMATYPIGRGTGLTTPAGSQFGERSITTETDVGDVAASWGIPGVLAYAAFVFLSAKAAYRAAAARRDFVSLGALAVVGVALSQWINGGLYAVAPLVWISLGWVDRAERDLDDVAPVIEADERHTAEQIEALK